MGWIQNILSRLPSIARQSGDTLVTTTRPEYAFVVKMKITGDTQDPRGRARGLVLVFDQKHQDSLGHHGYCWEGHGTFQLRTQMGWTQGAPERTKYFMMGWHKETGQMMLGSKEVEGQSW